MGPGWPPPSVYRLLSLAEKGVDQILEQGSFSCGLVVGIKAGLGQSDGERRSELFCDINIKIQPSRS